MPFQKGHKLSPGRQKGSKNRITLLKEERRAVFENRISGKWEEIIDELKPEYVADQFMGKAPETLILRGAIHIDEDIAKKNEITSNPKDSSQRQPSVQDIKVRKKMG